MRVYRCLQPQQQCHEAQTGTSLTRHKQQEDLLYTCLPACKTSKLVRGTHTCKSGCRPLQKLPIPVHIITGHLSVGKTTLISSLLRHKPDGEHWAVLVNEFGVLGIDAALLESSSATGLGALLPRLLPMPWTPG